MGRYTWIKLYTEILDDPKMGRLPNHLWRRSIELFLLAGKSGNDGALQPVEEMAWTLRLDKVKLLEDLRDLAGVGVVRETQPGEWFVVNFLKRQSAMSDAERKQKQRSGVNKISHESKKTLSRSSHDFVTEVEEEVEEESTTTTTTSAAGKNIFNFYSENFGPLTSHIADVLKDMEQTYSETWVMAALSEAVASEARNPKYVEAILKRWKTDGFQSQKKKPAQQQPARGSAKQTAAQAIDELAEWAAGKEQNVYTV